MDSQDISHDESENQQGDGSYASSNEMLSSSFRSFSSENDEDLRQIAATVAPAVKNLLDTNEAALEDEMAWLEEEEKFKNPDRLMSSGDSFDDEEDGINSEWNRLADAEQMLRDELEMSGVGFHFMSFIENDEDGEQTMEVNGGIQIQQPLPSINGMLGDTSSTHEVNNISTQINISGVLGDNSTHEVNSRTSGSDGITEMYEDDDVGNDDFQEKVNSESDKHGQITEGDGSKQSAGGNTNENGFEYNSSAIDSTIEKLIRPSPAKESYTLYDHAKNIGLQFDNADLGYPSCPLLTKEDAEVIIDIPVFRHDLVTGDLDSDSDRMSEADLGETSLRSNENRDHMKNHRDSGIRDESCRQDTICDIIQCTREYIKPMNSSALSRIFQGLTEGKKLFQKGEGEENEEKNNEDKGDVGVVIRSSNDESIGVQQEILPVRTVTIQIRPDVLVGAALDAVYTSVNSLNGEVTKRQGGHLRALIPGQWIPEYDYTPFKMDDAELQGIAQLFGSPFMQASPSVMNGMIFLPPFVVDVQLCTKRKSRYAERILLARFFAITEGQILDNGAAVCPRSAPHAPLQTTHASDSTVSSADVKEPNNILRESASLFQRMRTVANEGGNIAFELDNQVAENDFSTPASSKSVVRAIFTSPLKMFSPPPERKKTPRKTPRNNTKFNVRFDSNIDDVEAAQRIASEKLISDFNETPSVQDEIFDIDPIASLNRVDWPFIQSSWRFLNDCLNELDNRDLAFSTLVSCPFGAFPALPTLDVHYCSQMKDICKENMLSSLIKSAQELEIYAREAEAKCQRMMQILEPMFVTYEEDTPIIPEPIHVSSYPLDFTPPEVASPPWGIKVVEALNLIAAKSPSVKSGFHDVSPRKLNIPSDATVGSMATPKNDRSKSKFQGAKHAVNMVLTAFQKQEDEELSARLGRKNCQVMDRLAKMQAFKREAMVAIRSSYGINISATKAANKVHSYVKELTKSRPEEVGSMISSSEQVPLLTCRIIFGGSSGACYVTYNEVLLVTQSIPLVGGNHFTHVLLSDIIVEVKAGRKSRLNPIPSVLVVRKKSNREELFSFRPSTGANLFKDFIDTIAEVKAECPEAIDFDSQGGLIHMFDRKASVARAALGEEPDPEI